VTRAGVGRPRQVGARARLGANAAAATAALLFGASVVAVRVAVQDIPPLSLAVLRFGQAALLLVGVLLLAAPARLRVQRRSLPLLVLLGAVLFTLFPVTFNAGLRWTEASRGALMLATLPLWSALLAAASMVSVWRAASSPASPSRCWGSRWPSSSRVPSAAARVRWPATGCCWSPRSWAPCTGCWPSGRWPATPP
jgi:hypothetical protein